jgi:hypothetical protein
LGGERKKKWEIETERARKRKGERDTKIKGIRRLDILFEVDCGSKSLRQKNRLSIDKTTEEVRRESERLLCLKEYNEQQSQKIFLTFCLFIFRL